MSQMLNHCEKRLSDAVFAKYREYIRKMVCFPSDFWGTRFFCHSMVDTCEENHLKDSVVHFFTHDGLLQVRSLIEECTHREMEAVDASQAIDGAQIDLSGFIVKDLSAFCSCSNYVFLVVYSHLQVVHLVSLCTQSPYRSSLEPFLSVPVCCIPNVKQVHALLMSAYHTFEKCILALTTVQHCESIMQQWNAYLPTA